MKAIMWMFSMTVFVMGGSGLHGGEPQEQGDGEAFTVEAYLGHTQNMDNRILYGAKAYAKKLFSQVGVDLQWRTGKRPENACHAVVVSLEDSARSVPENSRALAFSYPYAPCGPGVTVLLDRIREFVAPYEARAPIILGYVMAHELGHVLEGTNRHSDTGLMRANWNANDIWAMTRTILCFAPEDRVLIRRNLANWYKPETRVQVAARLTTP